jgi:hypothetical protein
MKTPPLSFIIAPKIATLANYRSPIVIGIGS